MHEVRDWIQQGTSLLKRETLTSKAIWFTDFQMEVTNTTWVEKCVFQFKVIF